MKRALIMGLVVLLFFACLDIILVEATGITVEEQYETGMDYFQAGDYDHAFSYFLIAGEMKEYAPAQNMLAICYRDGLGTEQNIAEAERYFKLASDQGYQEAADNLIRMNEEKEKAYQEAIELFFDGRYNESKAIFESLGGYDRSEDFIAMCEKKIEEGAHFENLDNLKVGDIIVFGSYEQDNILANGKEPIEWQVLDVQGGRALIISKYGLDSKKYNDILTKSITWENCSLRKWLNDVFIDEAFTVEEQMIITQTVVETDINPIYKTYSGPETVDQIFVLSMSEAEKYFTSETVRQCKRTLYAKEQSSYSSLPEPENGNCYWRLRTPGQDPFFAVSVDPFGDFYTQGHGVIVDNDAIRPALWIK